MIRAALFPWVLWVLSASSVFSQEKAPPKVTAPPDALFERFRPDDRDVARRFYAKHLDVKGVAVLASKEVADEALLRTHHLVTHMLAGRPDVLDVMAKNGTRLIVIGKDQVYTDMPEYRNNPNPVYMNERVRGTGGLAVTSFGEENLLNLAGDRYDDESIGVHEFLHTIDAALGRIDPGWRARLRETYRKAMDQGLWKNTYAASNPAEYWAEIAQSYFDCNRINNWNHGPIATREQLKEYDPDGYELVRATMKLTPETDWRYTPLRKQPLVIAPPAKLKIDPYHTKFTYAREFPVLGSKHVSDDALLKANDTIRKMFAYRHDILKALIADGVKLVVLGRSEKLADLPELKNAKKGDLLGRLLPYAPETKLLAVGEENLDQVIRVFADAAYHVTVKRPVDPNWDNRGRAVQQYELRVKRLDVRFDEKLKELFEQAIAAGKWKGTAAVHDRVAYWSEGVLAYFDVRGFDAAPADAAHPINSRASLKDYDHALFDLVHETMAYAGHVDWRFKP
jgi:hypothetical protein